MSWGQAQKMQKGGRTSPIVESFTCDPSVLKAKVKESKSFLDAAKGTAQQDVPKAESLPSLPTASASTASAATGKHENTKPKKTETQQVPKETPVAKAAAVEKTVTAVEKTVTAVEKSEETPIKLNSNDTVKMTLMGIMHQFLNLMQSEIIITETSEGNDTVKMTLMGIMQQFLNLMQSEIIITETSEGNGMTRMKITQKNLMGIMQQFHNLMQSEITITETSEGNGMTRMKITPKN
jgi:hypothetical protein